MKQLVAFALALTCCSLGGAARAQTPTTLKIATLAPEGSSWMVKFHEWAKNVEEHHGGKVKIKLFAGLAPASAINLNRDDLARVVDLPKAIALIKRSHELDPKFYNAGAAMTLGIVYCSQGKAIGGDPDLGKKFFQEAIDASGGKYLMARVMYARFFGVITQDRPLFESTLKEVLAAPADLYPQQRLANALAKKRAKRYLDHVEDYF